MESIRKHLALLLILLVSSFTSYSVVSASDNLTDSSNITIVNSQNPENITVSSAPKIEIPQTSESPLALKTHAIDEMRALAVSGEDAHKLEKLMEHLRRSIENNFWDSYHIKSGEAFNDDKQAAQGIIGLIGNSNHDKNVLLSCFVMLLQADRILAYKIIEDAVNASRLINDPVVLDEINALREKAEQEYSKAEEHTQGNDYVVAIEFFGKAWRNANETISIADRNTVPKVMLTSPEDGAYTNVTSQTIAGYVEDAVIYTITNASLNLNGYNSEIPIIEGRFSRVVTFFEGTNYVNVAVKDAFGNEGSASANITLDTMPPEINITGVENGRYYNKNVSPGIKISDINLNFSSTLLDGISYLNSSITEEGQHVLEVYADDLTGNSASLSINFTIDKTPPSVILTSPENNSYLSKTIEIAGSATDLNLEGYYLKIDDTVFSTTLPYAWDTTEYEDGNYIIELYAQDKALNNASVSLNVTVDNTPPSAALTKPSNSSFVRNVVDIEGTAIDVNLASASLKINGEEVSTSLPYLWDTENYNDGRYLIELEALDLAGNSASANISVTVDNTLPNIVIISPSDGAYLRQEVEINAGVLEENLLNISVRINSSEVATHLPYFWNTSLHPDNEYRIEVYAMDRAGNGAVEGINATVDNTLPVVNLTSPANNSYAGKIVSIEGGADDANLNGIDLTINDVEVSSSLPYSWNTEAYLDVMHALKLSAWDRAGNVASVEIMVTVDNTAPAVSITSPLDDALLRQSVEINGAITEINIHSIALVIDGVIVADTFPFLWNTSSYPDGSHRIELNVSDRANNYASASINVTTDNTQPELTVAEFNLYPLANTEYLLSITTERDANVTVNRESVILDNGSVLYRKNLALGINEFTVVAIDRAGNPAIWSKAILVDEDSLPDWYEINVTGTDPLNADSDSTKTLSNEAANGIRDDEEDFDSDGILNKGEMAYGLDPFNPDSDGDGLTDWYELRITGTNPLLIDSNDNGLDDSEEDLDADLLNNLAEQGYNTDPLSNDTDRDSLSDRREISELGTDPLKNDTDDDFLDDSVELKPFFNTNPLDPDTNDNGILDGHELYEQTLGNKTLGIEVAVNASDDREGTFIFEDVGDNLKLDSDVFIGKPINILSKEKFSTIKIKMYYDESNVTDESDLAMFYFDEANHSMLQLENQSVNTENNYVLAIADHLSGYQLGYKYSDRFLNTNPPTLPQLKAGNKVKLYAKVHNSGEGEANDLEVAFYNGDPDHGGDFIGTDVIPSIGSGQSLNASIEWNVAFNNNYGINIFVEVDPDSTITETSEENNLANKSIDSDGDGLNDYDEVNGMRTDMGIIVFYTDPAKKDTDGDGLNDGEEMGDIMKATEGPLKGEYYYYLFSYPSKNADGITVRDSFDSDNDWLSDKVEHDFGSSGLSKDTDGDKLDDSDEWQLGTLPTDPDTDRDGLTDWWETVNDTSINKYGYTDPKNRDSDYDGAIDGGESNLYPSGPLDVNGDGRDDSGKEMDLNGDGKIEMGEENYYYTDPNNVTYFFDIFAVADREYRDYYWQLWDTENYKDWIYYSVDGASKYFMKEFNIKLKVVEISDKVWNSDDAKDTQILSELLRDANIEYSWQTNKKTADAMVAFTGKSPDYEGIAFSDSIAVQIPELSDPRAAEVVGFLKYLGFIYDTDVQLNWAPRLTQHEVSHLFGAYDYGLENPNYHTQDNVTGERLARIPGIMDKTKPSEDPEGFKADRFGNIWFSNKWNLESILIINTNKTSVTNGSYKKYI